MSPKTPGRNRTSPTAPDAPVGTMGMHPATVIRAVTETPMPSAQPGSGNDVATLPPAGPRQTKAAMLRALLEAPGGAGMAGMMDATGWQAHTVRAALTGLRKTGLILIRQREGTETIYAIVAMGPVMTGPAVTGPVMTGVAGEGAADGADPVTGAPDHGTTRFDGDGAPLVPTDGATT